MFAFTVRRVAQALIVMLVISAIGFAIKNAIGDPVRDIVGVSVSVAEREALRDKLGLNDPLFVQWVRFMKNALQGDLGHSFYYKKPAFEVILQKLPATAELVFAASIIIILFSVPTGIFAALKPNHWLSRTLMGASIVGVSIPVFLTAILFIYIFSVELHWLPSYGRGDVVHVWGPWYTSLHTLDGWLHIILPAIALSSVMLPLFVRLIRAEMKESLESEYVKFARAKGLRPRRVLLVHAFKNTLMPVITVGGVQLGIMLAFTVLTESVFQWKGLGFLFIEAVERGDSSLLVAYLIFVGAIFVTVNTVVDLVYGLVNPMVRVPGRK